MTTNRKDTTMTTRRTPTQMALDTAVRKVEQAMERVARAETELSQAKHALGVAEDAMEFRARWYLDRLPLASPLDRPCARVRCGGDEQAEDPQARSPLPKRGQVMTTAGHPEFVAGDGPGATQSPDWSPSATEGLRGPEGAVSDAEAERVWIACGRGICAAESGHEGTCDEASGWADVSPARDAVSDAEAAECARLTIDAELPWSIAVPRLLADRERLMDALADEAKVAEVSKAFHRLVVAERDFERGKNDRLRVQRDGLRATVRSMLGDAAAEGRCGCVALCEGPQEDCPLHGRDYAWWVGLAGTACADREWLMAENARMRQVAELRVGTWRDTAARLEGERDRARGTAATLEAEVARLREGIEALATEWHQAYDPDPIVLTNRMRAADLRALLADTDSAKAEGGE